MSAWSLQWYPPKPGPIRRQDGPATVRNLHGSYVKRKLKRCRVTTWANKVSVDGMGPAFNICYRQAGISLSPNEASTAVLACCVRQCRCSVGDVKLSFRWTATRYQSCWETSLGAGGWSEAKGASSKHCRFDRCSAKSTESVMQAHSSKKPWRSQRTWTWNIQIVPVLNINIFFWCGLPITNLATRGFKLNELVHSFHFWDIDCFATRLWLGIGCYFVQAAVLSESNFMVAYCKLHKGFIGYRFHQPRAGKRQKVPKAAKLIGF